MTEINLPLKVDLSGLDVDGMVKSAILDSKIGDLLKKAIAERVSGYSFEQTVRGVIDDEIRNATRSVLSQPEFHGRIRRMVEEKMTDEVVSTVVGRLFDQWGK